MITNKKRTLVRRYSRSIKSKLSIEHRALGHFAALLAVISLATTSTSTAAPLAAGTISSFAGGPDEGPALLQGQSPRYVAVRGNIVYISDFSNHVIRAIDLATGNETVVAGNLGLDFSGDGGPATQAGLVGNRGVAVDAAGNIYIAESGASNSVGGNSRIRKVDTAGIITTVAGNGTPGFSGDGGPATAAQLNFPDDVAVDPAGNLFIADTGNAVVRKVDTAGIITTAASGFSSISNVSTDSAGNVYITERADSTIRKLDPSGVLTTVAGNGTAGFSGDGGPATSAQLRSPTDTSVDAAGNLYIADLSNRRIRRVDTSGIITTVAGNGAAGFGGDGGPATSASLVSFAVETDAAGNLYLADVGNNRVRKVDTSGIITTIAGNGARESGPDGGPPATEIEIGLLEGLATGPDGSIYLANVIIGVVRKVSPAGVVTTVAGTGVSGFSGDGGPATSAQLNAPIDLAFDANGNLFIADTDNNVIRKVDTSGIITTVAGTGDFGFSGDGGPATAAQFDGPRAVELDSEGNLYIGDTFNSVVRKVDTAGIVTSVAGTGLSFGNSGDGGPATSALLGSPQGLAFDSAGNYYISDFSNNNVRKVDPSGIITTVAGTGVEGFSGDGGPATDAELRNPVGLIVDSGENLFIADTFNNRVRRVDRAGVINTVAGSGLAGNTAGGFGGDGGPATSGLLNAPVGLTLDSLGNLYVGDFLNNRIRVIGSGVASAVSRKVHNTVAFDVNLSLSSPFGVESRSGGANGDYQVVATLVNPSTVSGATVSSTDNMAVADPPIVNGSTITVDLHNVTNAQTIALTLSNVNDGTTSTTLVIPMGVLLGDVNGNSAVTNTDVSAVKMQVAAPVTSSNFRADVNANGVISNTDVSTAKAQVGTTLRPNSGEKRAQRVYRNRINEKNNRR